MAATSKFAVELLSLYKPFPAWEGKLFLSDLVNRAVDMDQSLPGTAKASHTQTAAFFDYACEIKLLDIIISSEFFERLARRIGRAAAAKVVGKILAKFIPVVGWIWLIGAIIWAFAEEFI
jgi:hypothetical protein